MASEDKMGAEMTAQVTALSTKLLEAIDRQADLEDQIQVMRKELDHTRRENMRYEDRVKSGDLVNKSMVALEKAKREAAELQVVKLQGEIEELTSSLFDEANRMVAQANRETNDRERRNDQLVQQLKERDVLLENFQEQLTGLKLVLQTMTDQQDDFVSRGVPNGGVEDDKDTDDVAGSVADNITSKKIPLTTASVYRPVVRHDLQNFHEFLLMIPPPQASPRTSVIMSAADSSIASGRASPANFEATTFNGERLSGQHTPSGSNVSVATFSATTISTTTNMTTTTTTTTSNISALTSRFQGLSSNNSTTSSLKDFKFFKRSMSDDIEPTLHLETAPGLSWLSRRNIMSSILDGSIVVEPIAAANEGYKLMIAEPEVEDSGQPEYIGLSKSISGSSGNTVQPTVSNGTVSTSYMPLNQPTMTAYVTSGNGQKIRTQLAACNAVGLPVATRAPCALCGEKRDSSLLYARLHNLRSGKDKHGSSNSVGGSVSKESNGTHGYHQSSDSIGSHMSAMATSDSNDKNSIDSNNDSISIDNEGMTNSNTLSGGIPGGFGNSGGSNSGSSSSSNSVSSGYPLCFYCLNRVRSVCDYVSFVRSIRAGLWKTEDEAGQLRAWEECVHLRERMFWARNGGYYIVGDSGQPMDIRMIVPGPSGGTGAGSGGIGSGSGSMILGQRQTFSKTPQSQGSNTELGNTMDGEESLEAAAGEAELRAEGEEGGVTGEEDGAAGSFEETNAIQGVNTGEGTEGSFEEEAKDLVLSSTAGDVNSRKSSVSSGEEFKEALSAVPDEVDAQDMD